MKYEFLAIDGRSWMPGKMRVSSEHLESATEGHAVTVLYNPDRPGRSIIYEFCGYSVA